MIKNFLLFILVIAFIIIFITLASQPPYSNVVCYDGNGNIVNQYLRAEWAHVNKSGATRFDYNGIGYETTLHCIITELKNE